MRGIILAICVIGLLHTGCGDLNMQPECEFTGTVRDMTGLDGCGWVIIKDDGEKLEPLMPALMCGTPPIPDEVKEDPLYNWEFEDGQRIHFSYAETESASICMVGKVVSITCIGILEESSEGLSE